MIGTRAVPLFMIAAVGLAAPTRPAAQAPLVAGVIDSGTVVRLHLQSGDRVAARLVSPFAPDSASFRYRRYGSSLLQGPVVRPAAEVVRIDLADGSRTVRGVILGTAACMVPVILFSPLAGDYSAALSQGLSYAFPICGGAGALIGSGTKVWVPAVGPRPAPPGERGAVRGALVGAAIGAGIPLLVCFTTTAGRCEAEHGPRQLAISLGVVGAVFGAVLGGDSP